MKIEQLYLRSVGITFDDGQTLELFAHTNALNLEQTIQVEKLVERLVSYLRMANNLLTEGEIQEEEKPFQVTLCWGTSGDVRSDYEFNSKEELDAFLYGVDESSGWLEYSVTEESEKTRFKHKCTTHLTAIWKKYTQDRGLLPGTRPQRTFRSPH